MVAALLKIYFVYMFTLYFNSKFFEFAGQMEPLHELCKSYEFKWVDDTGIKLKIKTTSDFINNF